MRKKEILVYFSLLYACNSHVIGLFERLKEKQHSRRMTDNVLQNIFVEDSRKSEVFPIDTVVFDLMGDDVNDIRPHSAVVP